MSHPVRRATLAALLMTAALAATACGSEEKQIVANRDVAEGMGEEWPLTVDEGQIRCPGGGQLVLEVDGTEYALNGLAQGAGYADIDPIWADDPEVDGLKVDVGWLISYGNTNCGY